MLFDHRISAQVADTHRQDLIAEAKRHRVAKATSKQRRRFPRATQRQSSTSLAIAS
jgi:hypothetical protein